MVDVMRVVNERHDAHSVVDPGGWLQTARQQAVGNALPGYRAYLRRIRAFTNAVHCGHNVVVRRAARES